MRFFTYKLFSAALLVQSILLIGSRAAPRSTDPEDGTSSDDSSISSSDTSYPTDTIVYDPSTATDTYTYTSMPTSQVTPLTTSPLTYVSVTSTSASTKATYTSYSTVKPSPTSTTTEKKNGAAGTQEAPIILLGAICFSSIYALVL